MKTQTRDRLPTVIAVEKVEPAAVVVALSLGVDNGGRLRVAFYGHSDDRHVTIYNAPSPSGRGQPPFYVRGAAYTVMSRLRHNPDRNDWTEATGEHAQSWVRRLGSSGMSTGYPSEAALATLLGACRVAAAAALEAIPHGWEIARFQRLQDQRQRDERTADDLREKLAEADRALHATESGLVDSFLRLRDLLPEDELDVLTERMGDG